MMFSRGSEWHKWDLHVHTPESVLKNDFGSDWDVYVERLFKKALEEGVNAIGVTDYFSVDGYEKLKKDYLGNPGKLSEIFSEEEVVKIGEILVVPNIEFRLNKFVNGRASDYSTLNRKINFHVIFSDQVSVDSIKSDFLNQLKFDFDSNVGASSEKRALTKSNLEDYGRKLKAEHEKFRESGKSDFYIGMMNASVSEDSVADILRGSLFKDNFMFGPNADEDLSKVSWDSQGHGVRKNLIKQSHFVFSSNPGTVKFMTGGFHDGKESFVKEFGYLKPCLWGSDAHDFDALFRPSKNRFTWVKSELSFSGLKQVVYDPLSRVRIQDVCPQDKSLYKTIRRVRFLDKRPVAKFGSEWIPISKDLTTIVGGKSSGKSLLLHHVAKTVNYSETVNNSTLSKASCYEGLSADGVLDFEVEWDNGAISRLSERGDEKSITYIPQLYINHLAESDGRIKLNSLVKGIICQSEILKEFLEKAEAGIYEKSVAISGNVSAYFLLRGKYLSIQKEIDEIGVEDEIKRELAGQERKERELREKSGFSSDEQSLYERLLSRKAVLERRGRSLERISDIAMHVSDSSLHKIDNVIFNFKKQILSEAHTPKDSSFLNKLFYVYEAGLRLAIEQGAGYAQDRVGKIPALMERVNVEIQRLDENLKPLMSKVVEQEHLAKLREKISYEKKKLSLIKEKKMEKSAVTQQGKEIKSLIFDDYAELIDLYGAIAREVEKPAYQPETDMQVRAVVELNSEKFEEFVGSFDRRGNIRQLLGGLVNDDGTYVFDISSHAEKIRSVFDRFMSGDASVSVRKGVASEEVIRRLVVDCFEIDYSVFHDGDDIASMSPGKRGLVLLNLLLHLSNSDHPILIDQPEDNLDNRTIYDQLKGFIRSRKSNRQIIMVTHNANLVISADAECVIVANQDGQNIGSDNKEFKFEYCSGPIENSFEDASSKGVLFKKGIRQHVCEILEGGEEAFKERELKYGLSH